MLGKLKALFVKTGDGHRSAEMEPVADGSVRIEGKTYRLQRWNRSAFVASPCGPHFSDGDEVSIDVVVKLPSGTIEFSGLAMVSDVVPEKDEVLCRFLDIEHAARTALDRHFSVPAGC